MAGTHRPFINFVMIFDQPSQLFVLMATYMEATLIGHGNVRIIIQ